MQSDFRFETTLGEFYTGGNIVLLGQQSSHSKQLSLFTPVRHLIVATNLQQARTVAIDPQTQSNLQCIDISQDGELAVCMGNRRFGSLYSLRSQLVLDTIPVPPGLPIHVVQFSPCARYVALGLDSTLQIFSVPTRVGFHSLQRLEQYHQLLTSTIESIAWSDDSEHLLVAGKDTRLVIAPRHSRHGNGVAQPVQALLGHRSYVIKACWADVADSTSVAEENKGHRVLMSVGADNYVLIWKRSRVTRDERLALKNQWRMEQFMEELQDSKRRRDVDDDGLDSQDDANDIEGHRMSITSDILKANSDGSSSSDLSNSDEEVERDATRSKLSRSERRAHRLELEKGIYLAQSRRRVTRESHPPESKYYYFVHKRFPLTRGNGIVSSTAFSRSTGILAVGYSTGVCTIHQLNDASGEAVMSPIQELSVSSQALTACALSPSGTYVALGSAQLQQLLVWDWRNESFLLKEQSHLHGAATCATFTPSGAALITGGEDGRVKVWSRASGKCIATFLDHQSSITDLAISRATQALYTSSRDGTCKGFDLVRYRCFRTFRNTELGESEQLTTIALDSSGELLAAASGDGTSPMITLWSTRTGQVVESLHGHEGAVQCLAFHDSGSVLYSGGAQDKMVSVWQLFGGSGDGGETLHTPTHEAIAHSSEILAMSTRAGKLLAMLLLNGDLFLYNVLVAHELELIATINTREDARGGWDGHTGPQSANYDAHFTCIDISPDCESILCGGNDSKWICAYHISTRFPFLIRRWPVTTNMDASGISEQFDYKNDTIGVLAERDEELARRGFLELPGARHPHFATAKRSTKLRARTADLCFAPHGRDWCAATSLGLQLYSLEDAAQRRHAHDVTAFRAKFAPVQLEDASVTSVSVYEALSEGRFAEALSTALILGEEDLGRTVLLQTPIHAMALGAEATPPQTLSRLIVWIAQLLLETCEIEHAAHWVRSLFEHSALVSMLNGGTRYAFNSLLQRRDDDDVTSSLKEISSMAFSKLGNGSVATALKLLHRALTNARSLHHIIEDNLYSLKHLQRHAVSQPVSTKTEVPAETKKLPMNIGVVVPRDSSDKLT